MSLEWPPAGSTPSLSCICSTQETLSPAVSVHVCPLYAGAEIPTHLVACPISAGTKHWLGDCSIQVVPHGQELTSTACVPQGDSPFITSVDSTSQGKKAGDKTVKSCFQKCQPAFSDTIPGPLAPFQFPHCFVIMSNTLINNPSSLPESQPQGEPAGAVASQLVCYNAWLAINPL